MAKKPKDDKFSPGHHMGKSYGYIVERDGSIRLAPGLTNKMNDLSHREMGLKALLDSVNQFASAEFEKISKARKQWWDEVLSDLDINRGENWSFNGETIRKHDEPPARTTEQPP